MAAVFFYISGHGFGHASRQIEVINALGAADPAVDIHVRTYAPRWLFERTARPGVAFGELECDSGVVLIDSLRLDEEATVARAAEFYAGLGERAAAEARLLRRANAALVVCDAPPLACEAAALAGIPTIVIANFTWDWIYEAYSEYLSRAPHLLPAIRRAYAHAAEAWRLPMHGGFDTFSTVIDVPFVARHSRREPGEVRAAFNLPLDKPLILSSFGGMGIRDMDLGKVDCLGECAVLVTSRERHRAPLPDGVHAIPEPMLYERGFRYEDLVRAADVVITKPGYGIISECIANDSAILYTSRGRFAEYDVLVAAMPRFLRCGFIDNDALFAGRWRGPLTALLASAPPPERAATDGATLIAQLMLERLQ